MVATAVAGINVNKHFPHLGSAFLFPILKQYINENKHSYSKPSYDLYIKTLRNEFTFTAMVDYKTTEY